MRAGPGCEGSHEVLEFSGGLGPVEPAVLSREFADVGDLRLVLFFAWWIASADEIERGLQCGRCEEG